MNPPNESLVSAGPVADLKATAAAVRGFFFAEEVPYGLAVVRVALPLVLLADLLPRWAFARELYSADGAPAPMWVSYGFPNALPELPGAVAVGLFTLLLASLLAASVGWMTRVSLAIATPLYFYFTAMDSIGTVSKFTVIATHVLLLLTVSNCGAVWSLDARRRGGPPRVSAAWPRRCVQLLLGIIYLGAAMTKFHTPSFFSGDQMMFWMLTHVNESHPVGEQMAYYPALLIVGGYASCLFEVLFLFLCWRSWGRVAMLTLGVTFHSLTYFSLGLTFFPLMYFSIYWCFLNDRDVAALRGRFGRFTAGLRDAFGLRMPAFTRGPGFATATGPLTFGLLLATAASGGVIGERLVDPYRLRTAVGPLALHEMPADEAARMLGPTEPLRLVDKFFSLELGTTTFADTLIGRKTAFAPGETLVAQCHAPPPHEDMYVEVLIRTADGAVLQRDGRVLLRERNRETFYYPIGETVAPGDYAVVLTSAGREITRRRFTITGPAVATVPRGPLVSVR